MKIFASPYKVPLHTLVKIHLDLFGKVSFIKGLDTSHVKAS